MRINKKFLAVIIFITCLVLNPIKAFSAAWVNFPSECDVGQAFAISITSTVDYTNPVVTWMNRTINLNVEQGGAS